MVFVIKISQAIHIYGLNATQATGIQTIYVIPAAIVSDGLLRAILKAAFKVSLPPSDPMTSAASEATS